MNKCFIAKYLGLERSRMMSGLSIRPYFPFARMRVVIPYVMSAYREEAEAILAGSPAKVASRARA
jgi:hypothetical protein